MHAVSEFVINVAMRWKVDVTDHAKCDSTSALAFRSAIFLAVSEVALL